MLAGAVVLFLAGLGWKAVHASAWLPPLALHGQIVDWIEPEAPPSISEIETPGAASSRQRTKPSAAPVRLDPNVASLSELESLPGIGPALARRIVEARASSPFRSLADLDRVKGLGSSKLEKLGPHLLF